MIYQAYSVRDSKTAVMHPPLFNVTEGEATRAFHALVNDPQSLPGKYPSDYSLWHVGGFNGDSGELTHITPVKLVDGDQLTAKSNPS